ncbi:MULTISPECIES: distal tail protein Dit [unclassified Lactococcus]|uniref:distal tail protein Dit n=1 Tax=unclassified Lactococcus TaxID=2643510 RepID=UPI00142FA35A|nr:MULTISPECIES: distal tail protein Dit [unclassified Lactococcus]KAF6606033.1 phage tail family protein [Lactococcus sp. EKM201L]KAF6612216.1 phage tail family protein [Lactococcus sp. EKM203L]KAF6641359.1 phage tail family protein [Lactococcus sp. EKM502L]KAF6641481.1 phage tail family protein [Lactococcus sp. EKM501L]KAF6652307.1 phage tail family protein [Lactococcus sp. EKM101L]
MFKVKYGEDYLTDYIRFIKVNRGAGTENDLSVEDNSGIGSKVIKTRRKAKEISMTFHVIDGLDVNVVREKLGKIISTTETKQLIFSDNPNFYYEAILTGTIEYTDDGFNADGGFTLLVPSGYAESVDTKVLNNDNSGGENGTIINNADNSVSVLINNNGTLPIYPTIKVTPTSETGYLAFVGQNGILEIGNPDEADTTTAKSQKLVCDFKTKSDFETNFVPDTSWTTSWPTNLEGMPLNSTIAWKDDGIRIAAMAQSSLWNAGVLRYEVPKDDLGNYVKDWHANFNTLYIQKNLEQCGRFQIHFADENKQPLACFEIYKGGVGENASLNFWLIGGDKKLKLFKNHTFSATTGKPDKNGSPLFAASHGGQAIVKQGNKISFYWRGAAETYLMGDGSASTKLAYVYVVIGKRRYYQMVADTSLRSFKLMNLNNEYTVDILNKYQPEDEVKVDMEKSKITVNDLGANSDYITGSEFFSIPPGASQKLDIVYSNFTKTPPKVEIEWKERIL